MLKNTTKSRKLEENLAQLIIKDDLKVGDVILSENRLATLFGVSRGTVRQAIGNLEGKGILRSEQGRGAFLLKIPKVKKNESKLLNTIAFVCYGGIDNPFMASIARGIEVGAAKSGVHLCVCSVIGDFEQEASVIRKIIRRGVDGLIIASVLSNPPSAFLTELCKSSAKVVMVSDIPNMDAPIAATDNREGTFLAVNTLIQKGHRKIAHIRGPLWCTEADVRFENYRKALELAGISFVSDWSPKPDPKQGYSEESGKKSMAKILQLPIKSRPTAAFVANDDMAIGAWEYLKKQGVSVPEEMSLIGFGNLRSPYERGLFLSSIDENPSDIGRCAWDLLDRLMQGDITVKNTKILLRPSLVERGSISNLQEKQS